MRRRAERRAPRQRGRPSHQRPTRACRCAGIAVALDSDPGEGMLDRRQIVRGQREVGRAEVLLQPVQLGRAGDRHDPRLLRQQPGERDLRRRRPLARGDLPSAGRPAPGWPAAPRARSAARCCGSRSLSKRGVGVDRAGQEALAERAERHEADAELLAAAAGSPSSGSRHHSEYSLCSAATGCTACARRIVCDAGFGQAEVPDLAFARSGP